MTRTTCGECNGSGYFAGTWTDIRCIDCGGLGSWDDEPDRCRCGEILDDGECAVCDKVLHDLRFTLEMQRKDKAA